MRTLSKGCAALLVGLALAVPAAPAAEDAAPMPQTRGMAGMDPALHDQWARDKAKDPFKDCTANAEAVAQQAAHPMPQTRGMAGMDARQHVMDCPEAPVARFERRGPRG